MIMIVFNVILLLQKTMENAYVILAHIRRILYVIMTIHVLNAHFVKKHAKNVLDQIRIIAYLVMIIILSFKTVVLTIGS